MTACQCFVSPQPDTITNSRLFGNTHRPDVHSDWQQWSFAELYAVTLVRKLVLLFYAVALVRIDTNDGLYILSVFYNCQL